MELSLPPPSTILIDSDNIFFYFLLYNLRFFYIYIYNVTIEARHCSQVIRGRCHSQVVREAPLWCRKSLEDHEFKTWASGKLSVNPAVNGYLLRIKEG